jgi:nitroreductase/dihydropteridine reductase
MAAFEEVDATPREGFDPATVEAILGLPAKQLRCVMLLPLGYRAAEGDWAVKLKKGEQKTPKMRRP